MNSSSSQHHHSGGTASSTKSSKTRFSSYHPIIPKDYTPGWIQDMKNRELIVQNANLCNLPYQGTELTLFLENRERLAFKESQDNATATMNSTTANNFQTQDRSEGGRRRVEERSKRIPLHSPLSKYQSSAKFFHHHQKNKYQ